MKSVFSRGVSVCIPSLIVLMGFALSVQAGTLIKFGKLNEGDAVVFEQDLDMTWNGGYFEYATSESGDGGALGSFRGAAAGAVLSDYVTDSELTMTLSAVNGNANDSVGSNLNGIYVGVDGGDDGVDGDLASRLIDENESFSIQFNKDVRLKGAGAMANNNYGVLNAKARISAGGSTVGWSVGETNSVYSYYYKDAGDLFVAAGTPVTLWTEDDGTEDNYGWSLAMLLVEAAPFAPTSLVVRAENRAGTDVSGLTMVDSDHIRIEVLSPAQVTNYSYQLAVQVAQPTALEWESFSVQEFYQDIWLYREVTNQWVRIYAEDEAGGFLEQVFCLQGGVLTAPPDDPISAVDYVDAMGQGLIVEADSYADVGPELDCVEIKKAGFSHVRMHIGRLNKEQNAASTPDNNPDYYTNLDRWIKQIARHGMYCHIGNKGTSVLELTLEDDRSEAWKQAYHDEMYDWWVDMAEHCRFMTHRLAYHLFLETGGNSFMGDADAMNAFHSAITEPVRLRNAERMIIYPPPTLNDVFRLAEMNFPYPDLNPDDGIKTGSGEYWFSDFHRNFAGGRAWVADADKQILEDNVQAAIDWMNTNDKPLILSAVRPTKSNSKHDEYISNRVRFIEHLYSRLDEAKYPIRITWLTLKNYNFQNGLGWKPGMRVLLEAMNREGTADADDPDGDLISTDDEINVYGTNPYLADSDQDNILDTYECLSPAFDPKDPADGHVLTDPGHNADFDGDGLGNAWELLHTVKWGENPLTDVWRFDPLNAVDGMEDPDADLVENIRERIMRINPNSSKSIGDNDGTDDWDADGINTLSEIAAGTWPLAKPGKYDRDYDGLTGDVDPVPYVHDEGYVAGYTFDFDATDSSSQGAENDGELMNGAAVSGGIVSLDGADDYVDILTVDQGVSSKRSVNLHFWAAQPGGTQLLYKEGGIGSGMSVYLEGSQLIMGVWDQLQKQFVEIGSFLPQQWYAVSVSFNGDEGRLSAGLYKDNVQVVMTNQATSITSIGDATCRTTLGGTDDAVLVWRSGAYDAVSNAFFSGVLDDVHIYNRELNAVEMNHLSRNDLVPHKEPVQSATLPYFSDNPIFGNQAVVGELYVGALTGSAVDPNGDSLTFAKLSGASWLNVETNGMLSGTPGIADAGEHEFQVQVSDDIHGSHTSILKIDVYNYSDPLVFEVLEDSFVQKNRLDENFGDSTALTMRNSISSYARLPYLKFSVSNVTDTVGRAILKVRSDDSAASVKAYAVEDNNWTESGLVWSNRPAFGPEIGSADAVSGEWFGVDITGYIPGDGIYSIALDEQDNLVSKLVSREGGSSAYLEIRMLELPAVTYYNEWSSAYALVSDNSEYLYDADGDGLNNLMEYALGGNPTSAVEASSIMPEIGAVNSAGTNVVEFIYRRRTDAAARGVEYIVETTTNLVSSSWSTNGYMELPAVPVESEFESVTNRMDAVYRNAGFVRIRVEVEE